jgi:hypothetical protein
MWGADDIFLSSWCRAQGLQSWHPSLVTNRTITTTSQRPPRPNRIPDSDASVFQKSSFPKVLQLLQKWGDFIDRTIISPTPYYWMMNIICKYHKQNIVKCRGHIHVLSVLSNIREYDALHGATSQATRRSLKELPFSSEPLWSDQLCLCRVTYYLYTLIRSILSMACVLSKQYPIARSQSGLRKELFSPRPPHSNPNGLWRTKIGQTQN